MVETATSRFPSLAAVLSSAAPQRLRISAWPPARRSPAVRRDEGETSPLKTRVGTFRQPPSDRLSRQGRRRRVIATGSARCAYKTASGRGKWPNRDPIQERGGWNLYGFIGNGPLESRG